MLLRARLWLRISTFDLVYSAIERVVGADRDPARGGSRRDGRGMTSTLQLLSVLRGGRSLRVLADRCGQPLLRLWALGVLVNATSSDTNWLVELPGGRVLSFDEVDTAAADYVIVVLSGSAGPKLVLYTPARTTIRS